MLLEGVLLGLTLSLMIGPLLFAIVQAALEGGVMTGVAVAIGVWLSDLLFVILTYYSTSTLISFTSLPHFRFWAGLLGALLLVIFGISALLSRPKTKLTLNQTRPRRKIMYYFLRGFLLNTINPFTVFFWLGVGGGVVAANRHETQALLLFFLGMMSTLALTDLLKAWGALYLRQWLTPQHIQRVQQGIGLLLILFGLVLAGRSMG